jgi:ATP-dependent Clp protease ATP-binding subunit ClpC
MSDPEFWSTPERFGVLGLVEYVDRIEAAWRGSASLLERLGHYSIRPRPHVPHAMVRGLAERLLLLDLASRGVEEGRPREAFVMVRAGRGTEAARGESNAFAARLGSMYRSWAEKRRMQLAVLDERNDVDGPYLLVLAISGFAAFQILEPESGLHVLETARGQKTGERVRVWVRVVPQPEAPAGKGIAALRKQALSQFAGREPAPQRIVRRYREGDAPLVRDSVRGWRTGRVDLVLGGDFDLLPGTGGVFSAKAAPAE